MTRMDVAICFSIIGAWWDDHLSFSMWAMGHHKGSQFIVPFFNIQTELVHALLLWGTQMIVPVFCKFTEKIFGYTKWIYGYACWQLQRDVFHFTLCVFFVDCLHLSCTWN